MPATVETDKTLILSTAHIPGMNGTRNNLSFYFLHETPDLDVNDGHDVRVSSHEYGWDVVITCALEDMGDLGFVADTGLDPDVPDWMKPAILLALASGCRRISYDNDGNDSEEWTVPGYPGKVFNLPVYDW